MRAKFKRENLSIYGFRVAEPQHDGTPHWHLLLFMPPKDVNAISEIIRSYSLAENANEKGAAQHRYKQVLIDPSKGTASGYIAKYISKNISGFGLENGADDNPYIKSAERVRAWASTWGIRQFQQIGGPSVTLWRECRKANYESSEGHLKELIIAADNGNWFDFIKLQNDKTDKTCNANANLHKIWNDKPNKYLEPIGYQIIGIVCNNVYVLTRIHKWTVTYKSELRVENLEKLDEKIIFYEKRDNGALAPLEFCQ